MNGEYTPKADMVDYWNRPPCRCLGSRAGRFDQMFGPIGRLACRRRPRRHLRLYSNVLRVPCDERVRVGAFVRAFPRWNTQENAGTATGALIDSNP
jgi:hypothetical protein